MRHEQLEREREEGGKWGIKAGEKKRCCQKPNERE